MSIERTKPLARIDGWPITSANLDGVILDIIDRARRNQNFTVFTLNLDHLVKLRRFAAFRAAYAEADIVTADGAPIAWLARHQNARVTRTTGADLVLPLVDAAAAAGLGIFLFGTSPDVMARAGRDLSERSDGLLDICGTLAPTETFDPEGPEADSAIETIRASGASIVFVALGAPKQEVFAARIKAKGVPCGVICVGAALDFLAGKQVRAPESMRNSGFEWLWRLATNPRRFARRYAECAGVLFDLVVIAPLRQRKVRG